MSSPTKQFRRIKRAIAKIRGENIWVQPLETSKVILGNDPHPFLTNAELLDPRVVMGVNIIPIGKPLALPGFI